MSAFQQQTVGHFDRAAGNQVSLTSSDARRGAAVSAFAKTVVLATFVLIFLGGLVTSHQAGMAVPDWPLSFGSLNPDGWWDKLLVRLEHGHRLFAMAVGLMVGILCAWVWESWRSLGVAVLISAVLPPVSAILGAPKPVIMHLAIWPAAVGFAVSLFFHARQRPRSQSKPVRALAFASFICVCVQATLGGLRVTQETAGLLDTALILRITHGVFGQTFLCVNVALAILLSRTWRSSEVRGGRHPFTAWLVWISFLAVFAQLIVGATMRHCQAGLAIPTFPEAAADGSWLPAVNDFRIHLNFLHTRIGAAVVTMLVVAAALRALTKAEVSRWVRILAWSAIALVAVQVVLGVLVIWHTKPQTLTTFHVVNGAGILATMLAIALLINRSSSLSAVQPEPRSL